MHADFVFTDSWDLPAPVADVAAVLTDLEHYPAWWAQVVAVARIDDDRARVCCRSTLPYTLDLVLEAVSRTAPVVEVRISGDLAGFARFTLTEAPGGTRLSFAQEVRVGGALALASYVGGPLLRWNHDRMMVGCRDGLRERVASISGSGGTDDSGAAKDAARPRGTGRSPRRASRRRRCPRRR